MRFYNEVNYNSSLLLYIDKYIDGFMYAALLRFWLLLGASIGYSQYSFNDSELRFVLMLTFFLAFFVNLF